VVVLLVVRNGPSFAETPASSVFATRRAYFDDVVSIFVCCSTTSCGLIVIGWFCSLCFGKLAAYQRGRRRRQHEAQSPIARRECVRSLARNVVVVVDVFRVPVFQIVTQLVVIAACKLIDVVPVQINKLVQHISSKIVE
jgi:hypothetical protein